MYALQAEFYLFEFYAVLKNIWLKRLPSEIALYWKYFSIFTFEVQGIYFYVVVSIEQKLFIQEWTKMELLDMMIIL